MENKYVIIKIDKDDCHKSTTLEIVYNNYKEALSDCNFYKKEDEKNFEYKIFELKDISDKFFFESENQLDEVCKFFDYKFTFRNGELRWYTSDNHINGWGSIPCNSLISCYEMRDGKHFNYKEIK